MSDFYRDRRVLILGGLGFIGSNLALQLVKRGADVTLVDCLLPDHGGNIGNVESIRDRVRVVLADIRDRTSLDGLVAGQESIFSLAAQASHVGSMHDPLTDLDINCRAELSLLECCRRVNPAVRLLFASTRQVYGRPQYLPVDEKHPVAPVDVNGVSKRASELFFALYHRVYGLHTVSLRLTNTYGPRLNLRGRARGFIGVFVERALLNSRIDVFGTGAQRRDFNYVDDVVEAFLLAGESDIVNGQAFNLGHPDHHSVLDFVHALQRHSDVAYRCVAFPPDHAAIDVGDYYGDFTRFREATGWMPRFDLDTGIARTLEFFRRQQAESGEDADAADVRRLHGVPEIQG